LGGAHSAFWRGVEDLGKIKKQFANRGIVWGPVVSSCGFAAGKGGAVGGGQEWATFSRRAPGYLRHALPSQGYFRGGGKQAVPFRDPPDAENS